MATTLDTAPRATMARGRRLLATTPGRLRIESVAIVVAAAVIGVLAFLVIGDHASSTARIATEDEPVIVSARLVQTSLAEANAAAATALVAGGVEDPAQRAKYESALASAAVELERTTRLIGNDEQAHEALGEMTADLPRYAGLIEAARSNSRQGFPVGAAYLDAASTLLSDEVYPGNDLVANRAAEQYRSAYDNQRGFALGLGFIVVGLVAALVAALVFVQLQVRRRFNRTINPPLLAAMLVGLALTGWLAYGLVDQTNHLTDARNDGYRGTRLYLDLRGAGFGAKADEARFLIARGAGEQFETDFGARAGQIDELRDPLADHSDDSAASTDASASAETAFARWDDYAALHDQVVSADRSGERQQAVALALTEADQAFSRFDEATTAALDANQRAFVDEMDEAQRSLRGLQIGSLIAVALVAALTAYGLQLRINEYR